MSLFLMSLMNAVNVNTGEEGIVNMNQAAFNVIVLSQVLLSDAGVYALVDSTYKQFFFKFGFLTAGSLNTKLVVFYSISLNHCNS